MRFKPSTIPTPLRTIRMEYDSDEDLSQLELDMLDKYMELHKELFVIMRDWKAIREEYKTMEKPQEEVKQQLATLNAEIKEYRQLAGFTKEEVEQMPDPGDLTLDPGELSQHGLQLEALFDPLYEKVQDLSKRFKDLEERTDRLEEQYEDFNDNYFLGVMTDTNSSEIDLIRLDDDFNEFNILMDDLSDLVRATIDERNVLVIAYNEMVQDMDTAFKRIDRVLTEINIQFPGTVREAGLN